MGARTNYTIVTTNFDSQNINVYAHWDGDEAVAIMQSAVAAALPRIKMGDTAYAVRIIIDQLTKHGRDSETGYGIYIGSEITAEEQYEYKEINLVNQTITVGSMKFGLEQFVAVLT
jgi:hypothetical protein